MQRPVVVVLVLLSSAFLAAGCAATGALENARASFDKAKAAGAESKAPYEYYAAEAYMDMAMHEADEGDTSQAKVYAGESRKYSTQALEKAGGGAK